MANNQGFTIDLSQFEKTLKNYGEKAMQVVGMVSETASMDMESYAKSNRPWQDRTEQARTRLKGKSYRKVDGYRAEIAHGVDYGVYLEFANERKYAILEDSRDIAAAKARDRLNLLFDNLDVK